LGATSCGVGNCAHTVNNCVSGVPQVCDPMAGATAEICDGADNDCDGSADEGCGSCYHDGDGDNYGDPSDMITAAGCPSDYVADNTDCNDSDPSIHPGATEICDGIDNDCDADTADGAGEAAQNNDNQQGICADSKKICSGGGWVNNYSSISGYQSPESTCDDGDDNDCDGNADCDDSPDCDAFCGCRFTITFPCDFL
jgi:hypothetical protein